MVLEKFGIGIDIVKINRFRNKSYSKNKNFYEKIFLPSEIQYCLKFKDSESHFAGKFAIKEAVKKSIPIQLNLLEIEIVHCNKKPCVQISKDINFIFIVSLSHEKEIAVGVVISEIKSEE